MVNYDEVIEVLTERRITVGGAGTSAWLPQQDGLGWTAAFTLLSKLIIDAEPALAAERERAARGSRGVHLWGLHDGVMNLTGRVDVLDARVLDTTLNDLAEQLGRIHRAKTAGHWTAQQPAPARSAGSAPLVTPTRSRTAAPACARAGPRPQLTGRRPTRYNRSTGRSSATT